MNIPLVDLRAQFNSIRDEVMPVIDDVMSSAGFIGGPNVSDFEDEFAAFCGTAHAVGVANGTDALIVALWAAGIRPGDEVIIPSHTFIATGEAVRMLGATPVFAEIDETTFNIDPEDAAKRIGPKTKAILPVHLYGLPAEMIRLAEVASAHGLLLLADGAQAHGATHAGIPVAAHGQATTFSFYPGKNLGAAGDAGAIVTDDSAFANRCRMIANHGREDKYLHHIQGTNARLDALQAAILRVKLRHLDEWCKARRAHADAYSDRLTDIDQVRLPDLGGNDTHAMHLYVIRVPKADRDALVDHLKGAGVGAGIHYPVPLHLQPCNADLGYKAGDFPLTEAVCDEIVSLPMYPELTSAQIEYVCEAVRSYFR